MYGDHSQPVDTSVIIVTYNNRTDIDACLQSVQAQSDAAEIIIVDNQSTDGTLDHIRQSYPTVRTVSSAHNGGFGAGVNLGAHIARGTYLAVVNPDTEVEAGWLQPLIEVLEQHPHVGLVTPTILRKGSPELVNACGNDVHITGLAFCAQLNEPAPSRCERPQPVAAVSGAAFVLRRSLWERLGGFDERFFMYVEDTDLSWRARRLGYAILHVPASRIWHTYALSVTSNKLYHLEHNRLLMLRKNLSPGSLVALLPALILTEAIVWLFCARNGTAYVRAKWRSYCSLRQAWSAIDRDHTPSSSYSRSMDRAALRSLAPRLAMEQLEGSAAMAFVNRVLTGFYAVCRTVAIVTAPS